MCTDVRRPRLRSFAPSPALVRLPAHRCAPSRDRYTGEACGACAEGFVRAPVGFDGGTSPCVKCDGGCSGRGACAVFTATTSENAGRRFYKCPAARDGGCNYFLWCDETPLHGGGGALARMLRRCSALEAQWLVRIVLRDMRIGGEACGRDTERAEWPRLVMEAFRPRLYRQAG